MRHLYRSILACCATQLASCFLSPLTLQSHISTTKIHIVLDPSTMDVGIAVVSAAAGAVSQLPRIQQLERELKTVRAALTDSENEMVAKIKELEDKLFLMDKEFEGQTEKFRKQYDFKMRDELERITAKMKTDFQYKLEIKMDEERSKLLSEKLDLVKGLTGGKQEELMSLRVQRDRVSKANLDLEKALSNAKNELDRLQQAASQKKGWWPF